MISYLDQLSSAELSGKRVLLRLDLNVPILEEQVRDDFRLQRVVETIDFLRSAKAVTLIVSHTESISTLPGVGDAATLVPVWRYLNSYFPVEFSPTLFTPEAIEKVTSLKNGEVLLFENLRTDPGEKANNPEFAKKLSQMADLYVNDAFAVSHRKHASIVGVPTLLPHYGGLLMRQEIENLSKAFNPKRPFVFIIGGAKFDTKLPVIKKYLDKADKVFVGGALSSDIFKHKGYEVGLSTVTEGDFGVEGIVNHPKLFLPADVTVTTGQSGEGQKVSFKSPETLLPEDCIVDAGPKTLEEIKKLVGDAGTIIWNGPLGMYEDGFADKTESLAEILSEASKAGAETIVGGGDTLAAIAKLGLSDTFTFLSTGGGAMLDFLVDETLPGIEALTK